MGMKLELYPGIPAVPGYNTREEETTSVGIVCDFATFTKEDTLVSQTRRVPVKF